MAGRRGGEGGREGGWEGGREGGRVEGKERGREGGTELPEVTGRFPAAGAWSTVNFWVRELLTLRSKIGGGYINQKPRWITCLSFGKHINACALFQYLHSHGPSSRCSPHSIAAPAKMRLAGDNRFVPVDGAAYIAGHH